MLGVRANRSIDTYCRTDNGLLVRNRCRGKKRSGDDLEPVSCSTSEDRVSGPALLLLASLSLQSQPDGIGSLRSCLPLIRQHCQDNHSMGLTCLNRTVNQTFDVDYADATDTSWLLWSEERSLDVTVKWIASGKDLLRDDFGCSPEH